MNSVVNEKTINKKTVSISQKRQFTIPINFYVALGFDTKADCFIRGNELIIRPSKTGNDGDFSEQILAELIAKGYQGEALLDAFKQKQLKVKKAIDSILADAESVAKGKSEYFTYDDIFNSED